MSQVEVTLSTDEVAYHVGIQTRSVCKGCDEGRYPGAVKVKNEWRIPLSSLPAEAYASYLISRIGKDAPPPDLAPEDAELLSRRWENATEKLRERSKVALSALLEVDRLQRNGQPMTGPGGIVSYIQENFGVSKSTLYNNITITKDRPRQYWAALLLPAYDGRNAKTTDFPKVAWYYFVKHVKNPGAKIKTAWEKTKREAKEQNWGAIPSYDTAKKLWKAVPEDARARMRGDEEAVKRFSPMARRDRTTLAINELWSTDSRRLDYWVIDPEGKMGEKGKPFRPWMTAYVEVRTGSLIGYSVGYDLNADLVQAAFINALDTTGKIIPEVVQADNGRENFAKIISGGAENRGFRRQAAPNEHAIIGLYPMLGIGTQIATPGHGQAKLVERTFGTLAMMHDQMLGDYPGAYCGNSPDNRPGNCDPDKAVPLRKALELLRKDIDAYNNKPSTGHGMDGKSPHQLYTELMQRDGAKCRRITDSQRRMCVLSRVDITIGKDGGFTILGTRFRNLETVKLTPGRGYYAIFNQYDLKEPVNVYRGTKHVAADVEPISYTPYRDKATAKKVGKARSEYRRAIKKTADAVSNLSRMSNDAYLSQLSGSQPVTSTDTTPREPLPTAQIVQMVPNRVEIPPSVKNPDQRNPPPAPEKTNRDIEYEEYRAARRKERSLNRTAAVGK